MTVVSRQGGAWANIASARRRSIRPRRAKHASIAICGARPVFPLPTVVHFSTSPPVGLRCFSVGLAPCVSPACRLIMFHHYEAQKGNSHINTLPAHAPSSRGYIIIMALCALVCLYAAGACGACLLVCPCFLSSIYLDVDIRRC